MYFELTFKIDISTKIALNIFVYTYGTTFSITKLYLTGYEYDSHIHTDGALLISDNNVISHIAHKYNFKTKEWSIRIGVNGGYFNSIYVEGILFNSSCVLIDKKGFLQEVDKSWGEDFITKKAILENL